MRGSGRAGNVPSFRGIQVKLAHLRNYSLGCPARRALHQALLVFVQGWPDTQSRRRRQGSLAGVSVEGQEPTRASSHSRRDEDQIMPAGFKSARKASREAFGLSEGVTP